MTAKRGVKAVTSVLDLIEGLEEFSGNAALYVSSPSSAEESAQTVKLSHCEVYALCLDEFSREEKVCGSLADRAVDDETRSLEETYNACVKTRLGQNITDVRARQIGWKPRNVQPQSLPSSLENEPCRSKLYVLKQHCSRLAKCCPDAQICRNEVDRSDRARYLRRRKESLAVAATKCRLQRYREIFKRTNLLHPESLLTA
ncbi:hypothetical protein OSTOST_11222, partial [Ostertagia ostertagi]